MPEPGPPLEGCRGQPERKGGLSDSPDLNQQALESAETRESVKQILLGPGQLYERRLQTGPRRRGESERGAQISAVAEALFAESWLAGDDIDLIADAVVEGYDWVSKLAEYRARRDFVNNLPKP